MLKISQKFNFEVSFYHHSPKTLPYSSFYYLEPISNHRDNIDKYMSTVLIINKSTDYPYQFQRTRRGP